MVGPEAVEELEEALPEGAAVTGSTVASPSEAGADWPWANLRWAWTRPPASLDMLTLTSSLTLGHGRKFTLYVMYLCTFSYIQADTSW